MERNFFIKSHGLGNDYIFMDSGKIDFQLSKKAIQQICDVHYGIGSDGILLKVPSDSADFGLKILNPDGSEAEKSGNGLRIFCKCLYDHRYTDDKQFSVETPGGLVQSDIIEEVEGKASVIRIDMGRAVFEPEEIPVKAKRDNCIDYPLKLDKKEYSINCVSIGNPHCVILKEGLSVDEVKEFGPLIEKHDFFPNRINVQFVQVIDRSRARILIWERGAGYTLASGSSSCAVAAVLVKKGLADRDITLEMPGGELMISIDETWNIKMTGAVQEIASGFLSAEFINMLQ
jgi:diaminopimelate epimerase